MRPDLDPGGERPVYFPITYMGPLEGANASLLGYDFYAQGAHREAMDRARDSGAPQATLEVGDSLLFYSDGLVEAHAPNGEMFGFPRLRKLVAIHGARSGEEFLDHLLEELYSFTGEDWEQEDDITLVALHRTATRD